MPKENNDNRVAEQDFQLSQFSNNLIGKVNVNHLKEKYLMLCLEVLYLLGRPYYSVC